MSFLGKLKHIISAKIQIDKINFNFINVQINSNNISDTIEYHERENAIAFNLKRLPETYREDVKSLIHDGVDEGRPLLENKSKALIEDIASNERSDDVKTLLDFFKHKIPPEDYAALRASLWVRKRFEEGADSDEIHARKGEIIQKYSKRGRNISNLCSSRYFENLIKPLYEEMTKNPNFTQEEFLKQYNDIIEEEAFAVFVSGGMSLDDVRIAIKKRIRRNLNYGKKEVPIHGIGTNNVETIKKVISELEHDIIYPIIKKSISEEKNIIFAKLWLK